MMQSCEQHELPIYWATTQPESPCPCCRSLAWYATHCTQLELSVIELEERVKSLESSSA